MERHSPLKRRFIINPHDATFQKTAFFIVTAVKTSNPISLNYYYLLTDLFCGLVVRVLDYRSGDPGSISGTSREKKKSSGSGTGSTQPREYNWGAT
jgi:hypothetical protein